MKFKNLEDKCLYYRELTDYRLIPNSYVIIMLDGRSFSKLIKNKYEKPFSEKFIGYMNETAKYVCKNVQGAKFAYVQSDEISIVLTDFDTPDTDSFFGNRLCKIQSIVASLATAKFNQLVALDLVDEDKYPLSGCYRRISETPLVQFDCKAWNVPTFNDVFAWFLFRQNDCIKNSKQQAAQTYLPHKELIGKNTDEQIEILKEKKSIIWEDYDDGMKYGRFIYKVKTLFNNIEIGKIYERSIWKDFPAYPLNTDEGKNNFINNNIIPKIE